MNTLDKISVQDKKQLRRILLNIALGGIAFTATTLSYSRASGQPDATYFYIIGISSWIFASILFILKPGDDFAHLSYLMSLGLMSVCSANGIYGPEEQGWQARVVPLFHFSASVFLLCMFLRCFSTFPDRKWFADKKIFRWLVYTPGIVLSSAMFISYLKGNIYQRSFFLVNIKPLLIPNLVFLFSYSIAGHACLLHTWISGKTMSLRKQGKMLFIGIGIGTIPVALFHTIPFVLGRTPVFGRFSAYTLILIPLFYGIAILRHRLMDVELVLNRSTVYAVVSAFALAIYLIISQGLGNLISMIYPVPSFAIQFFSAMAVALIFVPMKKLIQKFIDKFFYENIYHYRQTLGGLGKALSEILVLNELSNTILHRLNDALQPEFGALLLQEGMIYEPYNKIGNKQKLSGALQKLDFNNVKDRPLRLDDKMLIVPLVTKGKAIGFILLGSKMSGKKYNSEDISLMEILSHQTSVALENAIIHERLREQVHIMKDAYDRLMETFRKSHPEVPMPGKPASEDEDIILELDMVSDALIKSSEKLRTLDELKSQFISIVSHELRTPLTSIKGSADNLLDGVVGELGDRQRRYIERISRNCDRLVSIVNDLLNLSRIEAGKIDFAPENLSLFSLIEDTILEFSARAEKKGITLAFTVPSDLRILADAGKFRQIINNLLDNAIKFTDSEGKVSVHAEDKGENIEISVVDTGTGMPSDSLENIFDRFHQVQEREKGKHEGIGIGLAIVRSFVELHKGTIDVKSELGKGSQFIMLLPKTGAI